MRRRSRRRRREGWLEEEVSCELGRVGRGREESRERRGGGVGEIMALKRGRETGRMR